MKWFSFKKTSKFWAAFPPWLILGAAVILVPIFIFMTYQGIMMGRELTTTLLLEKGDALMRSFEAGIRTGAGLNWSDFLVQKLLIETAQQPGIDYLVITDSKGNIVADSDPSQVGEIYKLDSGQLPSQKIQWRRVARSSGADTFEVYRFLHAPDAEKASPWIIYAGLDMGPVLEAYEQNKARLALTALILLLIGFAGLASLMLAQNYRAARLSLSQIKIFSETLIENLPMGLIGVNREGKIDFFNRVAGMILGQPSGSVLGKPAEEVLPAPCRMLLENLGREDGIVQKEVDCQVRDSRMPLDVIATALKDDEGHLQGSIILLRDMTELRNLQRKVERSRRLASIGSLAGGVAHEIRNPLSSIKGFATYFKERYRANPDDVENADIMIHEVERLDKVIGQLLDFSRPLNLKKTRQSLKPLVSHTLKLIEGRAAEKGVQLRMDIPAGIPEIELDSDKMKQVLLNLTLNALEAMDGAGSLSVKINPLPDDRIEIDIADTGAGIDKEGLVHVFDPYFTTKQSGTGLGLAIVHKIIEAHDGIIRIDSEPGKGTTVKIVLPV